MTFIATTHLWQLRQTFGSLRLMLTSNTVNIFNQTVKKQNKKTEWVWIKLLVHRNSNLSQRSNTQFIQHFSYLRTNRAQLWDPGHPLVHKRSLGYIYWADTSIFLRKCNKVKNGKQILRELVPSWRRIVANNSSRQQEVLMRTAIVCVLNKAGRKFLSLAKMFSCIKLSSGKYLLEQKSHSKRRVIILFARLFSACVRRLRNLPKH